MQASDLPTRFPIPFAASVIAPFIRAIPQISSGVPGEASLVAGFPSETFVPVASGGIPPSGADFNGLLFQLSAWCRWIASGGIVPFSSTHSTAIAGYPAGALLASATTVGLAWLSIADNNVTDPDANGAGWIPVPLQPQVALVAAAGAFTANVKTEFYGLTGSGARSTTLPTTNLFTGCRQTFSDLAGNFNAGNLTVAAPGGMTIAGLPSVVLNVNRQTSTFRYFGSNLWSYDA